MLYNLSPKIPIKYVAFLLTDRGTVCICVQSKTHPPLRNRSISLLLAVDEVEDALVPRGRVGLVDRVLPSRALVYPDLGLREHELACN